MVTAQAPEHVAVTVVADDGDKATVELSSHAQLEALFKQGLHKLYGASAAEGEYELVINGVAIKDLHQSLREAGLPSATAVAIRAKDVSRG
jgi:hypothetical protein